MKNQDGVKRSVYHWLGVLRRGMLNLENIDTLRLRRYRALYSTWMVYYYAVLVLLLFLAGRPCADRAF